MSDSPWTKPHDRTAVTLCLKKKRYSLDTATRIANTLTARNNLRGDVPCRAYCCPHCGGYHVTRGRGGK